VTAVQAAAQSSAKSTQSGAVLTKGASEPQMIRVSDLVSGASVAPVTTVSSKSTTSTMSSPKNDTSKFAGKISGNTFEAASPVVMSGTSGGGKKGIIFGAIGGILILGLAGLAWYFYSGNAGLADQVTTLTNDSAAVKSQLATLKSQLDASSTGFSAQVTALTNANADLALNLSFFAIPVGVSSTTAATALPVTISGSLSGGGKAPYAITTPRGAKIFVLNSADAKISAQLKPIVGHTVQVTGTYVAGSDELTINTVTDETPTPPAAATSTPSAASTTISTTATSTTTTTATTTVTTASSTKSVATSTASSTSAK